MNSIVKNGLKIITQNRKLLHDLLKLPEHVYSPDKSALHSHSAFSETLVKKLKAV